MAKLQLQDSVSKLMGVGGVRATQLEELGISTIRDLLYHVPFRYETIESVNKISELKAETTACFAARVISKLPIRTSRFKSMLKVRAGDETGNIELTWFNTPFVLSALAVGTTYYFTGKVTAFKNKLTLTNPTFDVHPPSFGALIPIYHESAVINSRFLRKLIQDALTEVDANPALIKIHQPQNLQEVEAAKKVLAHEEMITLIKGVVGQKIAWQASSATSALKVTNDDIKKFEQLFSYALTPSQLAAIQAIALDLTLKIPMHRLLQGEVGSGKTTVAAFALWVAARQKAPALLICPTKILAQQHFDTLTNIFGNQLHIGLLTGKEKDTDANIIVGTHALFNLKNLKPCLVVIDEEHRFGVKQRETFFQHQKKPHYLAMTATPIPRTVALTALADRDLSFILPHKQNSNIKTWVVPHEKRESAHTWINATLAKTKGQALIVCPFIEVSYVETLMAVKSAKQEFETLKKIFAKHKLELLHGKLKEESKLKIFDQMMLGKTDILVTTPVVEVGVDIPAANIIVIEGAERYGLAALHQLRGRIGRRGQDAFCLLFVTENQTSAKTRLDFFAKTYDGNFLAEYDLKHRGSGELLGLQQHGFDALKFASWSDTELIEACKKEVEQLPPCLAIQSVM